MRNVALRPAAPAITTNISTTTAPSTSEFQHLQQQQHQQQQQYLGPYSAALRQSAAPDFDHRNNMATSNISTTTAPSTSEFQHLQQQQHQQQQQYLGPYSAALRQSAAPDFDHRNNMATSNIGHTTTTTSSAQRFTLINSPENPEGLVSSHMIPSFQQSMQSNK